jgi:hypothetical protein
MKKKEVHFTIDGNAGENNTIVNMVIGKAYNVNPTAKVVNNTFNIYGDQEGKEAVSEAVDAQPIPEQPKSAMPKSLADTMKNPVEGIDCSVIRKEILVYVSRIRPLVAPDKKDRFMKMWEGILDLDAVKSAAYKTGKQKETNFNRKLIANIIHHLDSRRMYAKPYKASDFAMALEENAEKSVRGELGKFPSDYVSAEIDAYLESQDLWHKV